MIKQGFLMITIHHFPFSQHSRRVISLLEEAGIEYDAQFVDLMKGEHFSPQYLHINPNHQVPTLIDNKGQEDELKIHESNAIMRYICDKYELDSWYPKNLVARAQVEQWLDWVQCQMSPAVVNIVYNTMFAGENADQAAIEKGQTTMLELAEILEQSLAAADYLTGDAPTIADLALASNVFHLGLAKQAPQGANVQAWYGRVSQLEGFKKSLPAMS
jgi:glutathione S-transferase